MAVPELLRRLLTAPGPSGYETPAATVWREAASEFAEVTSDALGSSVARVRGTGGGPLLALLGHIDEIGLLVTHVDEDGFVYFLTVGGTRPDVLHGQRVELLTRQGSVPGVIGRKSGKRPKPGEKREQVQLDDLHVDIGARNREEALGLLQIGDVAVIAGAPVELSAGRIASRSLDNRLGAYVALEAARAVAGYGGSPGDVAAVAAVQEEVGDYGGARTTLFALEPQVAIAIDVTGATDIPEGDPKVDGEAKLGAGPIVNRGSTINPKVFELLVAAAEAEGIPYAVNVSAGDTHTDMDAAYASRAGIATGLVSLATRYIHTPGEIVSLDDVEAAIRLIAAFAGRLAPGLDFTR
ncbi:MAG: M20/M25/M40 family metallo-hydrolase [Gaiellaceae bacterium]